jgi:hypothetical protein
MTMNDSNDDFIDLSDAEIVIPSGVYRLRVTLRLSSAGGLLRWAKNMRTKHLECEYIVVGGEHAGHRISDFITLKFDSGEYSHLAVLDDEQIRKYEVAVRMGKTRVRAIIESAHSIDPRDDSEAAKAKRESAGNPRALDGLEFCGQVDVRKGRDQFRDQNFLDYVITSDLPDYIPPRKQWWRHHRQKGPSPRTSTTTYLF